MFALFIFLSTPNFISFYLIFLKGRWRLLVSPTEFECHGWRSICLLICSYVPCLSVRLNQSHCVGRRAGRWIVTRVCQHLSVHIVIRTALLIICSGTLFSGNSPIVVWTIYINGSHPLSLQAVKHTHYSREHSEAAGSLSEVCVYYLFILKGSPKRLFYLDFLFCPYCMVSIPWRAERIILVLLF